MSCRSGWYEATANIGVIFIIEKCERRLRERIKDVSGVENAC